MILPIILRLPCVRLQQPRKFKCPNTERYRCTNLAVILFVSLETRFKILLLLLCVYNTVVLGCGQGGGKGKKFD